MPLDYSRDDQSRTIVLIAQGHVSMDAWRGAIGRQIAEGCWSYGLIYDGRGRTNEPSIEEANEALWEIDLWIRRHGPRGPVAFIAKDLPQYDLGRTYGSLAERLAFPVETFAHLEDARRWLAAQLATGSRRL